LDGSRFCTDKIYDETYLSQLAERQLSEIICQVADRREWVTLRLSRPQAKGPNGISHFLFNLCQKFTGPPYPTGRNTKPETRADVDGWNGRVHLNFGLVLGSPIQRPRRQVGIMHFLAAFVLQAEWQDALWIALRDDMTSQSPS